MFTSALRCRAVFSQIYGRSRLYGTESSKVVIRGRMRDVFPVELHSEIDERFGGVKYVDLAPSKKFGFVHFNDPANAKKFVEANTETEPVVLSGVPLTTVDFAKPEQQNAANEPSTGLHILPIPEDVTEQELRVKLEQHGSLFNFFISGPPESRVLSTRVATAIFREPSDALRAYDDLQSEYTITFLKPRQGRLPSRTLHFEGFDGTTKEIRDILGFEGQKGLLKMKYARNDIHGGKGTLTFGDVDTATAVLEKYNGARHKDGALLKLNYH